MRLWAAKHGVAFSRDACGNILMRHRRGKPPAKWAFEGHIDHPGFIVRSVSGRTVEAEFAGWVKLEYFRGERVKLFALGGPVGATVVAAPQPKETPFIQARLRLDRAADLRVGDIGMWDLPPMRVRGTRWSSRACDNLVGSAAVVCALGEIIAAGTPCDLTVLLTRAEEAGFIGTLGGCEKRTLPRDAFVVAVETSKAQPGAPLGAGVVVRVGDSIRTFDPSLTAHISAVAAGLARRDKGFHFVRQLMPGGATEASAYLMYGWTAAALCVPLGNYHNMGDRGKIAAEQIDLGDFESLIKLLAALPAEKTLPRDTDDRLRKNSVTCSNHVAGSCNMGGC